MLVSFVFACFDAKYANQKMHIYQQVTSRANHSANQCESNAGHVTTLFSTRKEAKIKPVNLVLKGFWKILGIDLFSNASGRMAEQTTDY